MCQEFIFQIEYRYTKDKAKIISKQDVATLTERGYFVSLFSLF
jgi:hypothetical protein